MSNVDVNKVLYFDIETHSADKLWEMEPHEFFRLGSYAHGRDGEIRITTSYHEMRDLIRFADRVVVHNGLAFDLMALFRDNYLEVVEMAYNKKIVDTFVLAHLFNPAPSKFTDYKGHTHYNGNKPEKTKVWLSLENQAFQIGVQGKFGDIRELAKAHNPEKTPVSKLDYGLIPLDDPDFVAYAKQDVEALRGLAIGLLDKGEFTEYTWREMLSVAIDNQISANGFTVDIVAAQDRVEQLAQRKEVLMSRLQEQYGLPTEGKQPWRTSEGKEAIFKVLAEHDITPETVKNWTKTATGNYSLGGDVVKEITAGTDAEELGEALAELMGQRSLAELALESVKPDGKVHPDITSLQRSGRRSVTRPGLTIWGARGDKAEEKEYFIASKGRKLLEADYSNADARIVAAVTGDKEYAKRFGEGVDGHEISGRIAFGEDYDNNPTDYRNKAKILSHAYNYGCGFRTLARNTGLPEAVTRQFVERMNEAYPEVTKWRGIFAKQGESGFIWNDWGRRMVVDPEYSFTQSFALIGQSGTSEIMKDALIRMFEYDPNILTWVVAPVHDALVFDVPEEELDKGAADTIQSLMETVWKPKEGGQEIDFPVSVGKPSNNWREAGH